MSPLIVVLLSAPKMTVPVLAFVNPTFVVIGPFKVNVTPMGLTIASAAPAAPNTNGCDVERVKLDASAPLVNVKAPVPGNAPPVAIHNELTVVGDEIVAEVLSDPLLVVLVPEMALVTESKFVDPSEMNPCEAL